MRLQLASCPETCKDFGNRVGKSKLPLEVPIRVVRRKRAKQSAESSSGHRSIRFYEATLTITSKETFRVAQIRVTDKLHYLGRVNKVCLSTPMVRLAKKVISGHCEFYSAWNKFVTYFIGKNEEESRKRFR